jgi:hypothetical protein
MKSLGSAVSSGRNFGVVVRMQGMEYCFSLLSPTHMGNGEGNRTMHACGNDIEKTLLIQRGLKELPRLHILSDGITFTYRKTHPRQSTYIHHGGWFYM